MKTPVNGGGAWCKKPLPPELRALEPGLEKPALTEAPQSPSHNPVQLCPTLMPLQHFPGRLLRQQRATETGQGHEVPNGSQGPGNCGSSQPLP